MLRAQSTGNSSAARDMIHTRWGYTRRSWDLEGGRRRVTVARNDDKFLLFRLVGLFSGLSEAIIELFLLFTQMSKLVSFVAFPLLFKPLSLMSLLLFLLSTLSTVSLVSLPLSMLIFLVLFLSTRRAR